MTQVNVESPNLNARVKMNPIEFNLRLQQASSDAFIREPEIQVPERLSTATIELRKHIVRHELTCLLANCGNDSSCDISLNFKAEEYEPGLDKQWVLDTICDILTIHEEMKKDPFTDEVAIRTFKYPFNWLRVYPCSISFVFYPQKYLEMKKVSRVVRAMQRRYLDKLYNPVYGKFVEQAKQRFESNVTRAGA